MFPPDPDAWVNILVHIEDTLPARVKGTAYWVEYENRDESCYHVRTSDEDLVEA